MLERGTRKRHGSIIQQRCAGQREKLQPPSWSKICVAERDELRMEA